MAAQRRQAHSGRRSYAEQTAAHLGRTVDASADRDADRWGVRCLERSLESGRGCHLSASADAEELQAGLWEL